MEKFKQKLLYILDNISDGVIGVDVDGNVALVNDTAKEVLEKKEIEGAHIQELIPNTRMIEVLTSGRENEDEKFLINKREFIVKRMPIVYGGEITGAIGIFKDRTLVNDLSKKLDEDRSYINTINTLLDTAYDWAVVVDKNNIIRMMSKGYREFLGVDDPVGKDVRDVIENTRLHTIVKTGIAEIGEIQEIRGHKIVSMRVPIIKEGKVVGAIGKVMFKDLNDFFTLGDKLKKIKAEIEEYKGRLNNERSAKYSFDNIIGNSKSLEAVKNMGIKAAGTDSNVMINGESGTGKELFSHAIHNSSKRYLGPFVEINCAAIPSELLESELFGYEEGAFTGAKKGGKKGKFELANGGTIFLDEIGDMPLQMQGKLLRVLQEREVERVGGNKVKKVDVRIIAATNRDLEDMVKNGEFREDLYYRLNVMTIKLPSLRERGGDVILLADHFRTKLSRDMGKYVEGISKEACEQLSNYHWPGNIRELENIIERAINLLDSDLVIRPHHLPARIVKSNYIPKESSAMSLKEILEDVEKKVIRDALREQGGNKNKVARILGMSRTSLYKKIDVYNI